MTRDDCLAMDSADPLAALREAFDLPPQTIYLDGNSLGALPRAALRRAQELVAQEWGHGLIRSWNAAGWFELPLRLGNKLAPLIGAGRDEVVITDSTSVNLFKLLAGALRIQAAGPDAARRKVIVAERDSFPTDLYMVQGLASLLGGYRIRLIDHPGELEAALDRDTAVLLLNHVNYRTGYLFDMQAACDLARAAGALTVWDLAHSAGALPVDLHAAGADFAVGCTYKYLNGGPGAPAFAWIAPRHYEDFTQPLSGWWSHHAPFAMQPDFTPAHGIRRALCGTQPILSLALVECGLDLFGQAGMPAIRAKSLALSELFIGLVEQECAGHPLELVSPRAGHARGSHVSFAHPDGYAVMQALIAQGVIGDYREPRIMRFGLTPLYTRYIDIWDAVQALRRILERRDYRTDAPRAAVT